MEFHQYEASVLKVLLKHPSQKHSTEELKQKLQGELEEIQIKRAFQWLENKELISTSSQTIEVYEPTEQAKEYAKTGTPDLRILKAIEKKQVTKEEILAQGISIQEFGAGLGRLKKQNAITVTQTQATTISKSENYTSAVQVEETLITNLQNTLKQKQIVATKENTVFLQQIMDRKGTLSKKIVTNVSCSLTEKGKKISIDQLSSTKTGKLTRQMLISGDYKKIEFRPYNLNDPVPQIFGGRHHFVSQAVDYIKSIWTDMGFSEMSGDYVQSAFWDLDTLFVPQDHPARTMQDTFYIDHKSNIPQKLLNKVKKIHETGEGANSKGWQYTFNLDETQKTLLRTHCTALSAHTLSTLKIDQLPAKYFAVGKVFRNEAVDWSHLMEFHQVEGIVIDKNANFSTLIGYLELFFKKMGYDKIRIRPAYFPYTEPSAEIEVYHPVRKKWVELGGCGMFRPEVVIPLLGEDITVLAWGLGVERIIVEEFGFKDLRDLYNNDLETIQNLPQFMRM